MRQKRLLIIPFILLALGWVVCILCLPATAAAQNRVDVKAEIEKTDRLWESARDVLPKSGPPPGEPGLKRVEQLQDEAREALKQGDLRRAEDLTHDARNLVLEALAGLRRGDESADGVRRELEQTDRVLQDVHQRIGAAPRPAEANRLRAAEALQSRAWDMYHRRELRPALKLTLEARDAPARLDQRGSRGRWGAMGNEAARGRRRERIMDRLGQAMERLGSRAEPDNRVAQEQLDLARSSYAAAEGAIRDERWALAERYIRQTREALLRAAGAVERDLRHEDIAALLEDAERRHEEMAQAVHEDGSPQLQDRLKQAGDDLHEAGVALDTGALREALIRTRAALDLMDRISEELER
ncbi:MAG: hypothetical protein AB1792_00635 [Candidatus Zixiibacteriota bacterium]